MTILLPVINYIVDEIVLEFLRTNQYRDQSSYYNSDWNHNNKNSVDENNNNQVEFDDIGELVGDWATEPWAPCDDVDIPDWAKLEGPKVEERNDLVWAEDPWIQTPLTDIPAWMQLSGIDYDVPEETGHKGGNLDDTTNNDEDFLSSCVEVDKWSDEEFLQYPLDVPSWALLPGIDYPTRRGKSLYWEKQIQRYERVRNRFSRKIYGRIMPTILEEKLVYNNDAKPMLFVPGRYCRMCYWF
ncbi:hypothetical protein LOTGIDRAFT_159232 [Lottia gigantea]|uniref:Uncharacterized protein n=1 Tax=Lottia gigantea TaxID=225164 RepID=V4C9K0_LOTGI|nr:hypothetical protein LOTGIDRAFT_159232 [Lottia gigantea]ESO98424.1 hypothetical protein LOTGIDRAFT_159232 [Lottia gigantea]